MSVRLHIPTEALSLTNHMVRGETLAILRGGGVEHKKARVGEAIVAEYGNAQSALLTFGIKASKHFCNLLAGKKKCSCKASRVHVL